MSAGDFLLHLAQGLLLLLSVWKLIEWGRRRDGARRDIALLMLALGVAAGTHWLLQAGMISTGLAAQIIPMAVALHPLFMLRLVDHFRSVPRWIAGLFIVGVVVSWALVLAVPADVQAAAIALRVIFALSLLYASRALVYGARHAQGVVRRRMGLVGAGASIVVLLAVLHAADLMLSGLPHVDTATQVGVLAAAAFYCLGLAPPAWLSRSWQQADVQQFLRTASGSVGETPDRTITRLCSTALHATGGQAAALASWNEARHRLELELRGERALVGGPLPTDGLVARNWTFRRPFVVDDRKQVREACLRMAPGLDCTALLGVPLITPSRVWGLIIVFLRRGPVLPEEDLRLLTMITEHTAVLLDHAALVGKLRREIAELRGEPLADETPFDES